MIWRRQVLTKDWSFARVLRLPGSTDKWTKLLLRYTLSCEEQFYGKTVKLIERLVTTSKFFRAVVYDSETIIICGTSHFSGYRNNKFPFVKERTTLYFPRFSVSYELKRSSLHSTISFHVPADIRSPSECGK